MYKGVKKNQHYTWLICAAQNMKNIAIKKSNIEANSLILSEILNKYTKMIIIVLIFIKNLFIRKPLEKI